MTRPTNIVWFRQDLRTRDNPALAAAAADGNPVIPLLVNAPNEGGSWAPGAAARRRRPGAIARLAAELAENGSRLIIRDGEPPRVFAELAETRPVKGVFWNRRYEPYERRVEHVVRLQLENAGVTAHRFTGNLLFAPDAVQNAAGGPYKVFTPFWNAVRRRLLDLPQAASPARLKPPDDWPHSEPLPTEPHAAEQDPAEPTSPPCDLAARLDAVVADYAELRDRPDRDGTARLSPCLQRGEIGPGQVWRAVARFTARTGAEHETAAEAFRRQLVWREFAYHFLYHFPDTTDTPLRPEFLRFPWRENERDATRWMQGRTGYPFVDAGMRQLARTGWMHNRVRLVVASFLVKHLLIDWRIGARHFWETLADADLANNTLGWQWVAGSGADAAPYFRIFNPVRQGQRFDPEGDYVKTWLPELAALPARWSHRPWQAPADALAAAGVRLGETYPEPIVDHDRARQRALRAYERTRKQ